MQLKLFKTKVPLQSLFEPQAEKSHGQFEFGNLIN